LDQASDGMISNQINQMTRSPYVVGTGGSCTVGRNGAEDSPQKLFANEFNWARTVVEPLTQSGARANLSVSRSSSRIPRIVTPPLSASAQQGGAMQYYTPRRTLSTPPSPYRPHVPSTPIQNAGYNQYEYGASSVANAWIQSPHAGSMTPPPPYAAGVIVHERTGKPMLSAAPPLPEYTSTTQVSTPPRAIQFATTYGRSSMDGIQVMPGSVSEQNLNVTTNVAFPFSRVAQAQTMHEVWNQNLSPRSLVPPVSPLSQFGYELIPSTEFKFFKDWRNEGSQLYPSPQPFQAPPSFREPVASFQELPPPPPPFGAPSLQQPPPSNLNVESQIQELLEGQESLRYEVGQVKMQVQSNYSNLEDMRRERTAQSQQPQRPPPPVPFSPTQRELSGPPGSAAQSDRLQSPTRSGRSGRSAPPPQDIPRGVSLESDNASVLKNLGYIQNDQHLADFVPTLKGHASRAMGTARTHATRAIDFAKASSTGIGSPANSPNDETRTGTM